MKSKAWSKHRRFLAQTKKLQRFKKLLKRLRAKRGRRNAFEWKKSYERELF